MSKTTLVFFWVLWLLDVLAALFGYREFIGGIFGRYATPSFKYVAMWVVLLVILLLIIVGSLCLKNREQASAAMIVAVIPLVLALPYALFLGAMMLGGKKNWQ